MSFWNQFGVNDAAEVSEDPYTVKDNVYKVQITQSDETDFKKGGNAPTYWSVQFTITEGPEKGKTANQLFRLSPETSADSPDWESHNTRNISNIKKFLLDVGIPVEAMNQFDPRNPEHRRKVLGISGTARMFPAKKPGYNNITDFKRFVPEEAPADIPVEGIQQSPAQAAPSADALSALNGF